MASLERASKSKQILLKHYSLKINRLRETERKELPNLGLESVFNWLQLQKHSPTYFYY